MLTLLTAFSTFCLAVVLVGEEVIRWMRSFPFPKRQFLGSMTFSSPQKKFPWMSGA